MSDDEKKIDYYDQLKSKLDKFENYEYFGKYKDIDNNIKNKFMKEIEKDYPDIVYPGISDKCACGHDIKINGYIRNKITKEIIVMGSCCIKRFKIKKHCFKCDNLHTRIKYNICKNCEKIEKEKSKEKKKIEKEKLKEKKKIEEELRHNMFQLGSIVIDFGKHKNKTIEDIYNNDISYIKWCIKTNDEKEVYSFRNIIKYYNIVKQINNLAEQDNN